MKYFNIAIAILLLLVYVSGQIPPMEKYNLWIISYFIPVALVLNVVLILIYLSLRNKITLYYLVLLLIGSPYIFNTVGIKHIFKSKVNREDTFSVMSYNLGGFQIVQENKDPDVVRKEMTDWLLNSSASIQCYQEFENMPWHENFNITKQLDLKEAHYYFSQEDETDHSHYSRAGTLIVSRFPIVAKGDLLASKNGFNRISFADLQIGQDTLRVINVHLESMGLGINSQTASRREEPNLSLMNVLNKLKEGTFERIEQNKKLIGFIEESPYPVICAGDFNDLPYSYSYQLLKRSMKNSFEESGAGFGFTFAGRLLNLLRIDNQFYTHPVQSVGFETLYSIDFSNHFPIQGEYRIIP